MFWSVDAFQPSRNLIWQVERWVKKKIGQVVTFRLSFGSLFFSSHFIQGFIYFICWFYHITIGVFTQWYLNLVGNPRHAMLEICSHHRLPCDACSVLVGSEDGHVAHIGGDLDCLWYDGWTSGKKTLKIISWWLNQPIWRISVKFGNLPHFSGWR